LRTPALPLTALLLAGCGGATSDPGLDLQLQVRGAQLVRGPLPAGGAGPTVTFVDVRAPRVTPGDGAIRVGGRTSLGAYALNLATDRDEAYWVLPSGYPDSEVQGELSWEALLDFSRALEPGPFQLLVQATDGDGQPGAVTAASFEALPLYPPGELVVTLEWAANADADLLVEDPAGVTLGGKNVNTWSPSPPGSPPQPPDAWMSGATMDFDSNANCVIDGRRRESAVWSATAPAGRYRVLVALAQSCGLASSAFQVSVRRQGTVLATTSGVLYESDALGYPQEPPKAAGVLALEFDVP
jgi:hypothetical protein